MKKVENIVAIVVAIFLFLGVFMNAYAAQDSYNIGYKEQLEDYNKKSAVPIDETNAGTTSITHWMSALSVVVTETVPEILMAEADYPAEQRQGLISKMDDSIEFVYDTSPNINVYAHLADEWVPGYDKTNGGVYAADSGYQELMDTGVSTVWSNMRNLAYVFFIVIMLVAGFMIMFRHKVGGQALVTLGNALPNIIVSLILVTFSFAIAGFIIDIGGVVMAMAQDILGLNEYVSTHNLFSLMGGFFNDAGRNVTLASLGGVGLATAIIGIVSLSGGPLGLIILGSIGLLGLLLILGIVGIVLVGSIRVLITLIKAYIGILFSIVIGPLQLAFGAVPGNQQMIKNWFSDLFRNVLTFPLVFFIMNLPLALVDNMNLNLGFPEKLVYVDSVSDINTDGGLGYIIYIHYPVSNLLLCSSST